MFITLYYVFYNNCHVVLRKSRDQRPVSPQIIAHDIKMRPHQRSPQDYKGVK